jgi:flagellum-specific peptidoglycan hydrolase FlgJ
MKTKRLVIMMIGISLSCFVGAVSPETKPTAAAKAATAAVRTVANANPVFVDYIRMYYKLAIQQQQKYKIPASITLAQALLESDGGQSYLALAANNHFGVKNTDWKGLHLCKYDAGEYTCFRKYLHVHTSFEDHSRFIAERPFYRSLFSLRRTDYKSWAMGLKKCGYACDPNYDTKLIRLIENYHLHYYDTAGENDPPLQLKPAIATAVTKKPPATVKKATKPATATSKRPATARK